MEKQGEQEEELRKKMWLGSSRRSSGDALDRQAMSVQEEQQELGGEHPARADEAKRLKTSWIDKLHLHRLPMLRSDHTAWASQRLRLQQEKALWLVTRIGRAPGALGERTARGARGLDVRAGAQVSMSGEAGGLHGRKEASEHQKLKDRLANST